MSDPRQIKALADAIVRYFTWRENMEKLREKKQRRRRVRKSTAEDVPMVAEEVKTGQVAAYPSAEDYTA